jgi:putative transcriptional regulator
LERDVIKCHLSKLMGERKLKISDVARDTGLHRNTITLLYQETATRSTLKRSMRCAATSMWPVGDLFEWREGDDLSA